MAEKLFFSCIQTCDSFICQPNKFLSTYVAMAKGLADLAKSGFLNNGGGTKSLQQQITVAFFEA